MQLPGRLWDQQNCFRNVTNLEVQERSTSIQSQRKTFLKGNSKNYWSIWLWYFTLIELNWPWSTLCGSAGSPWRCGWGWWCCLWHWHWCDVETGLKTAEQCMYISINWVNQLNSHSSKAATQVIKVSAKALPALTKGDVSNVVPDSGVCVLQLQWGLPVIEQHLGGCVAGSPTLFKLLHKEQARVQFHFWRFTLFSFKL